ncbi:uncharacterized protein LOC119872856 [Canis lupus familiaris]|uniref:uncharacterized protein LOC119872856 n=1 Tax=Canis lupus familiaris TaxID=9615 RepID=UPI0018F66ED8|nr:uncharacterized protein LOC119872856 [Canis lupus familiaris]XP_038516519.1 uncharacterized protein LOC119872856 [Canis lupus familiaris]
MATLKSLMKLKICKKKKGPRKFIQYQSDPYVKIMHNWEKPKGIDNRKHRRFKGQILMPNTGYRSNKEQSTCFPKFLIHSIKELEVLLMCNKSHWAEIAHNVSSKNLKATVETAAQFPIRVTNPNARLCSKENEWITCVPGTSITVPPRKLDTSRECAFLTIGSHARANRIYLENLPNTWQQQKLVLSSLIKKLDRAWKSLLSLSWKEGVLCLNRDTVEVLLHLLTQEEASTIHTGSPGQPRGMGEVYSWTTVLKSQLHVKNYRGLLPT